MSDTPKDTAAKIEAVAKDVIGKGPKGPETVKSAARSGEQAVRDIGRAADETLHSAQETARAGLNAATQDIPNAMREVAERGVRQMKDAYDRFRVIAEDTGDIMEESYSSTTRGLTELQLKVLDSAKENTNAAFDFARDLMNVRSFSEAIELQTAFMRRRFEAFTGQMKDVTQLTTRVTTDAARPVRAGIERSAELLRRAS